MFKRSEHTLRLTIYGLVLLSAISVISIADDTQTRKTLSVAIHHLEDEQPQNAVEIDEFLQGFDSSSPLRPIAIQTGGFLFIQSKEYSKAWKLLSRENDAMVRESLSLQLGHDRLMLWLALESGQTEKATQLFKKLVKQLLSNSEASVNEKRILADFLGRICAIAGEDSHPKSLSQDLIRQAISRIESQESKSVARAFRSMLDKIQPAGKELTDIHAKITMLSDQDATATLDLAKKDLESTKTESQTILRAWESDQKTLRKTNDALKEHERQTRKLFYLLRNTEEPGRPELPSKPREPSEPYDESANKSKWYEYNADMREYNTDLRTYPARLADWQDRNAKRQLRLTVEHAQSVAQTPALQAAVKAQQQIFDPINKAKLETELSLEKAERGVRFIEASIQTKTSGNNRSIHRPSLFPVLDYASESERLISAMRAATKSSD